ncbi:SPFH domain-containing protein [Streptomyces sp. NPDC091259]|uniref:SPFH domain-containing protein n=1 Tax=Streptomyces sp. NPDC091259 TaxID=3365976 RepID=UPI00382E5892
MPHAPDPANAAAPGPVTPPAASGPAVQAGQFSARAAAPYAAACDTAPSETDTARVPVPAGGERHDRSEVEAPDPEPVLAGVGRSGPAHDAPHDREAEHPRPHPDGIPAARAQGEPGSYIPHPQEEPPPAAPRQGVVADLVGRAVARVLGPGAEDGRDDDPDLPHAEPVRGATVTAIPVHLPFLGQSRQPLPAAHPLPQPSAPRAKPHAAGRRVPRGDDSLREHRGPVLPGWVAVGIGGLALTGCAVVLWRAGAVPDVLAAAFGAAPRAYHGLPATSWPPLAFLGVVALLALGGLGRAKAGHAWVLTLFGRYRGTVRRTGLTWVSPLLLRRRVDVRLRHWRSEPMPAVDAGGLALQVVVQVVWQVKDTARATLAVADHTEYLAEQVESAMARVLSQLPADAFHEDAPTLRDAEAVGDALTRMVAAETEAVGIEVFSAQPTRIEYAPEVAEAMRRRRVAAIDAKHRDTVLTSVVDAVDDTVHRLTSRGIVELDDYERKALVKDLTVAFYTGRADQ